MKAFLRAFVSGLALASSAVATQHGRESEHGHRREVDALVASQILTDPYAYDFPRLDAPGASLFPMRHCHGFKLEEASVDEIQSQLSNGSLTSVQLLGCYMDRIHQTQPYLK